MWSCETSARVLDLSNNSIKHVPSEVGRLSSTQVKLIPVFLFTFSLEWLKFPFVKSLQFYHDLQKLLLNVNEISEESISWDGLAFLKHLTVLSLSHNL